MKKGAYAPLSINPNEAILSSTGRCNTCRQFSAWRFKVQRLTRPRL